MNAVGDVGKAGQRVEELGNVVCDGIVLTVSAPSSLNTVIACTSSQKLFGTSVS